MDFRPANHEIRTINISGEIWYHLLEDTGREKITVGTSQDKSELERLMGYLRKEVPVLDKI